MGKKALVIVLYGIIGFLLAFGGLIVSSRFNTGYYGGTLIVRVLGVIGGFFCFFIGFHLLMVALISLLRRKK